MAQVYVQNCGQGSWHQLHCFREKGGRGCLAVETNGARIRDVAGLLDVGALTRSELQAFLQI